MKNKAAVVMARARWDKTTPEQRKEHSKKMNEAKNIKKLIKKNNV